jgi:hypothetical protein
MKSKRYWAIKSLIFGVTCILSAFYFATPTLFTFENALILKTGKIKKVETYYKKNNERQKISYNKDHKISITIADYRSDTGIFTI